MSDQELQSIIAHRALAGTLPPIARGGGVPREVLVALRRREASSEPIVWPNLPSAIWDRLANSPALADLGGRVYLTEAPAHPEYPFLVFSAMDAVPIITNNHARFRENQKYTFQVIATDTAANSGDQLAYTLGTTAFSLLSTRPDNPPLQFADGYDMTRTPLRRFGPYRMPNLAVGNRYVWAYVFEYQFQIGRWY